MLKIKLPAVEGFDESKNEFIQLAPPAVLQLEHSLIAISKWEAKWKKPFLSKDKKTHEETIYYIRCMTINKNVDPSVYDRITSEHILAIQKYMEDPHSATTVQNRRAGNKKNDAHVTTSEEIYYSMFYYGIPIECAKWHFNNLRMLLKVAEIKGQPAQSKMTQNEVQQFYASLNSERRAKSGSRG